MSSVSYACILLYSEHYCYLRKFPCRQNFPRVAWNKHTLAEMKKTVRRTRQRRQWRRCCFEELFGAVATIMIWWPFTSDPTWPDPLWPIWTRLFFVSPYQIRRSVLLSAVTHWPCQCNASRENTWHMATEWTKKFHTDSFPCLWYIPSNYHNDDYDDDDDDILINSRGWRNNGDNGGQWSLRREIYFTR